MALTLTLSHDLSSQNIRNALSRLQLAANRRTSTSGGLAIKVGGSAIVKTVSAVNYQVDDAFGSDAAADMAALVGTIADGSTGLFAFVLDSAGTQTTVPVTITAADVATAKAALNAAYLDTADTLGLQTKALIGYVTITASGADFVGGTTALDAGAHVVAYTDTPGFNPASLAL